MYEFTDINEIAATIILKNYDKLILLDLRSCKYNTHIEHFNTQADLRMPDNLSPCTEHTLRPVNIIQYYA